MSRFRTVVSGDTDRRVLVGVPTYNGAARVADLFASMRSVADPTPLSLVVLDDGSPRAGELEKLSALCEEHHATLLAHEQNAGITASWNDLVRFQDAEFVVLLNDDLLLTPRWLENLIYFLEQNECGAASPNLLFCDPGDVPAILRGERVIPRHPHTRKPDPAYLDQHPDEIPGAVMCALGSGFGFRRSVYDAIGGFDEAMRQIYNESFFGSEAARKLRLPSYCIPAPRIWHLWSQTFKENPQLGASTSADRAAYVARFGGDFTGPNGTHARFMAGMPPRLVRWIGPDGEKHEQELSIQ